MKASGPPRLREPACWAHNLSVVISCPSTLSTRSRPLQPCQDPAVIPNVYRATERPTQERGGVKQGSNPSALPVALRSCGDLPVYLRRRFQRGKLNMFKAINVISAV